MTKRTNNCCKKSKHFNFENRSSLYFNVVKRLLRFKISGSYDMAEEIVNKHSILGFGYEKNT